MARQNIQLFTSEEDILLFIRVLEELGGSSTLDAQSPAPNVVTQQQHYYYETCSLVFVSHSAPLANIALVRNIMTQGKDMVLELSQRIEVVTCEDSSSPRKPPATPLASDHRPLDDLAPASDPIHFPKPSFARGRRAEVLCYIPQTGDHKVVQALFRDLDEADKPMAYAPVPGKRPIKTIMGHVEICVVLEPCCMDESQSDDDESNGDDEMVFQSTNQYVAVKVNDCERMDQLKGQHAEDPLQEIAAMQLAQAHPNVLGIIEVLFDGKSLNVVLPYCDKGDLFQVLQDYSMQSDAPGMPEGQVRYWFRQVLAGVRHLHAVGICHRDLSPENVMIRGTQGVVIDLGMALRVPYEDEKGAVVDVTRGRKRRWIKPQGTCVTILCVRG